MFCPAFTGFGLAEFVTLRSACVAPAPAIMLVAALLFGFVSCVAVATGAVSVMMVPAGVPAFTLEMAVTVPVERGGTLGFVQDTGDELGQVQVPPPVVTTATDTNVVLRGNASLNVAAPQLLGPEFVMTCV